MVGSGPASPSASPSVDGLRCDVELGGETRARPAVSQGPPYGEPPLMLGLGDGVPGLEDGLPGSLEELLAAHVTDH